MCASESMAPPDHDWKSQGKGTSLASPAYSRANSLVHFWFYSDWFHSDAPPCPRGRCMLYEHQVGLHRLGKKIFFFFSQNVFIYLKKKNQMGLCAHRDFFLQAGATEPGWNNDGCEDDIDIFLWTKHSADCRELQKVKHELVSRVEKHQWDYLPLV